MSSYANEIARELKLLEQNVPVPEQKIVQLNRSLQKQIKPFLDDFDQYYKLISKEAETIQKIGPEIDNLVATLFDMRAQTTYKKIIAEKTQLYTTIGQQNVKYKLLSNVAFVKGLVRLEAFLILTFTHKKLNKYFKKVLTVVEEKFKEDREQFQKVLQHIKQTVKQNSVKKEGLRRVVKILRANLKKITQRFKVLVFYLIAELGESIQLIYKTLMPIFKKIDKIWNEVIPAKISQLLAKAGLKDSLFIGLFDGFIVKMLWRFLGFKLLLTILGPIPGLVTLVSSLYAFGSAVRSGLESSEFIVHMTDVVNMFTNVTKGLEDAFKDLENIDWG